MRTIEYIDMYLLEVEKKENELIANINGVIEDINIIETIGIVEENSFIHMGLTVEYHGEIISLHTYIIDVWKYVYKDEAIEIMDALSDKIGQAIEGKLKM